MQEENLLQPMTPDIPEKQTSLSFKMDMPLSLEQETNTQIINKNDQQSKTFQKHCNSDHQHQRQNCNECQKDNQLIFINQLDLMLQIMLKISKIINKKRIFKFARFPFSSNKKTQSNQHDKRLKLTKEFQKEYNCSMFQKIGNLSKNKDYQDIIKSVFIFKDCFIPNSKKDKKYSQLVQKSYFYLLCSKFSKILMPYFLKNAINIIQTSPHPLAAIPYVISYTFSSLSMTFFDGKRTIENSKVIQTAWFKLSMQAFKKLLEMDLQYQLKGTKSQIFNIERVRKSVQQNLQLISGMLIPAVVEFSLSSILIWYYCGFPFFINLLISFGLYIRVTKNLALQRKKVIQKSYNSEKRMNFLLNEALSNYYNLKIFNSEKLEMAKYSQMNKQNVEANFESMKFLAKINIQQKVIISLCLNINLIMAVIKVVNGTMMTGEMIFMIMLLLQIFTPIFNLGNVYRGWHESFIEINELMELLSERTSLEESKNASEYICKTGNIKFQNVCFYYDINKPMINNLNFELAKGETLLITGASGIGKSTLVHLLMRLVDPIEGKILLDDQDIKNLKFSFREQISVCSQNHHFLNSSILTNLRVANFSKYYHQKELKDEYIKTNDDTGIYVENNKEAEPEIVQYCKDFNLYDRIISFEEKFDYVVGDVANKLSGGERQRLNLIRSLLKKANIRIFDEPTNFLDQNNQNLILNKLQQLKEEGVTVIIISHTVFFEKLADKILCFTGNGNYEYGDKKDIIKEGTQYEQIKNKFLTKKQNNQQLLKTQIILTLTYTINYIIINTIAFINPMVLQRKAWNKLEYILITLGGVIGFSCIWRFPYLLYINGLIKQGRSLHNSINTDIISRNHSVDSCRNGNWSILQNISLKHLQIT